MAIRQIECSALHAAEESIPLILSESKNGSFSVMLRISDANYLIIQASYLNAISVVCAKRALSPACAGNDLNRRM
jgi:hypothetical protein